MICQKTQYFMNLLTAQDLSENQYSMTLLPAYKFIKMCHVQVENIGNDLSTAHFSKCRVYVIHTKIIRSKI